MNEMFEKALFVVGVLGVVGVLLWLERRWHRHHRDCGDQKKNAPLGGNEVYEQEQPDSARQRAMLAKERLESATEVLCRPAEDPEAAVVYRLAALWRMGEKAASLRIEWVKRGNSTAYRLAIRRADGTIEHPSEEGSCPP